jgi:nucleotide-binding universal stress UspA family protein
MLSLKVIAVPVDFSERSTKAAEHAAVLAKHFDSQLLFLHVMPPSPLEYAGFEGGYYTGAAWPSSEDFRKTVDRQMEALLKSVAADRPIEKVVMEGDPARLIEKLVDDRKVDLLVMPTHGYGPFRRFVLGSVTAKVLHDVACPVFTGAHLPEITAFNPDPYKRIACAIDLGEHSEAVLRWAWEFAQSYEEDLTVIHAAPQMEVGGAYGEWFPPETRESLVNAVRAEVQKLVDKVGCKADIRVDSADPVRYVREVADEAYADLLVIGRSPRHGLLGRLRTHAYALIREAPCPVVSV